MLSLETTNRLAIARSLESTYQPNSDIAAALNEKTLIMLVGPAAVGKSFLIHHIVAADKQFYRVPVFSTRDPRPDDEPGMFRLYPHDDEHVNMLLDKIEAREVVQYAIHPTSGRIYGTMLEDFAGRFNLLATLSDVVEHLGQLPFKNTFAIGLAARPDTWAKRFNQRYPHKNDEQTRRIAEAISSLSWLLASNQQSIVKWVDNTSTSPAEAIQSVINIVKYGKQGNYSAQNDAQGMLEIASKWAKEEKK